MNTLLPHPEHFWADKHEAKDLAILLSGMPIDLRIRWLRLCCLKYSQQSLTPLDVVATTGEVLDLLTDFYSICDQNGVTLEWATRLAEYLRTKKHVRDALDRANAG